MQGTTGNISVAGMLRFLSNFKRSGALNVTGKNLNGKIYLKKGEIVSVEMEQGGGADTRGDVISMLLVFEGGAFYFDEKDIVDGKPAGICVEDAILESARRLCGGENPAAKVRDYLLPENEVLKIAAMPRGKSITITFTDFEWNLLRLFNGDGNIKNALDSAGREGGKAEAVLYGLVSAGLVKRTRFKVPEIVKIAKESMGNIGAAIVDSTFSKKGFDRTKMGMKEFIYLLNDLESAFADITGKTQANEIIEKIWEATK